jgi:hypothetical protein
MVMMKSARTRGMSMLAREDTVVLKTVAELAREGDEMHARLVEAAVYDLYVAVSMMYHRGVDEESTTHVVAHCRWRLEG